MVFKLRNDDVTSMLKQVTQLVPAYTPLNSQQQYIYKQVVRNFSSKFIHTQELCLNRND